MSYIKILFTGGTIGSSENDGFICADTDKKYALLEIAKEKLGSDVGFSSSEVCNILSENITAKNLADICRAVREACCDCPDGIIITHGTDTLSYSAAFLSYLLSDLRIPVLLVSSNYVLSDKRANGAYNFIGAVEFILSKKGKGIFVAYKNSDGTMRIHRGTRLLPQLPCSDDIFSLKNSFYAEISDGAVIKNGLFYEKEDELEPFLPDILSENVSVLFLEAAPFMSLPRPDSNTDAVLIKSFHSGTLPTENKAFVEFCEASKRFSIPIFLVGAENRTQYASTRAFSDLGIITLPTMSPCAAYAKLTLLLKGAEPLDSMKKSLSGDIM